MVSKGSELLLQSRRGQHSLGRATTWLLQAAGGGGNLRAEDFPALPGEAPVPPVPTICNGARMPELTPRASRSRVLLQRCPQNVWAP